MGFSPRNFELPQEKEMVEANLYTFKSNFKNKHYDDYTIKFFKRFGYW